MEFRCHVARCGCDSRMVDTLCWWYEVRELCEAEVTARSMTTGSKGQLRVNPAATELDRIDADLDRMEATLGLTPRAQARYGFRVAKPASKLDELTKRRRDREPDPPSF
ncbi:MAG: Phage terminase, small subunit [Actinomycetota bacterium]|nr:Phage terminase, small subunit [Actinomycetota bacterium]